MPENPPFVSIVMAVRDESEFIVRSLGSVLAQEYPLDRMEILIADGNSSDDTVAKIEGVASGDTRIQVIKNPMREAGHGLNLAITQAQGDYILRVDGHAVLQPDYVRTCVRVLQETGAQCVGGKQTAIGLTPMGRAIATANASWFCVPSRFKISDYTGPTDTVYLGAWPRYIFDHLQFDTRLRANQDYMLAYQIRRRGGIVYLSPEIRSLYYGRQTLRSLWQQYFRYGRYKLVAIRHAPGSVRWRHLVAPVFVLTLISGAFLSLLSNRIGALWQFILSVYGVVMGIATLQIIRKQVEDPAEQYGQLWRMPLVFLTVHLAWGLGFLLQISRELGRASLLVLRGSRERHT